MTEIHKVKCDKCGTVANMRVDGCYIINAHKLPRGWNNIEKNWFIDMDICPKCKKKMRELAKRFLNK